MAFTSVFSFDMDLNNLDEFVKRMEKLQGSVDRLAKKDVKKLRSAFAKVDETITKTQAKMGKPLGKLRSAFAKVDETITKTQAKMGKPLGKLRSAFDTLMIPIRKVQNGLAKVVDLLKKSVGSARLLQTYLVINVSKGIWDKATNFSDLANSNKKTAHTMNSSVKNIKAIDYAFDLWGSEFDRDTAANFQNNLSDVSKWGSFGALGIGAERITQLKKMDGADAFMSGLQAVIKRINDFGGFDNETSKAAFKGHVEDLGLNWEELKALNKNGRLNEINKTYEERKKQDHRDYTGFEKFERIKKGFIQTLDDIWEGLVSKLLPIVNIVTNVITKIARKFSEMLGKSDVLNKLSKTLEEYGDKFANWISNIDFSEVFKSVINWFAELPSKIKAFMESIQAFMSTVGNIVGFFDKEKGEKIKESLDPTYAQTKREAINKAMQSPERGVWARITGSGAVESRLNEAVKKGKLKGSSFRSITNAAIKEMGAPYSDRYNNVFSKEFSTARDSLESAIRSKQVSEARAQGKEVEFTFRWVGNEAVLEGRDKDTSQTLIRQTIIRR